MRAPAYRLGGTRQGTEGGLLRHSVRTARQKRSAARIDMAEQSDNSRMTTPVTFSPTFYRFAAICSVLSAFTTLGLIFLPQWFSGGADFDSRMARVDDPVAQLRAWIYLLHPFLVAAAAVAVAVRLRWTAPGLALFGVLGFLLWAGTEAGQQALSLVAFDRWRHAWLLADEGACSALRVQIGVYDGLWDAMYFLLLIGFMTPTAYAALRSARSRPKAGEICEAPAAGVHASRERAGPDCRRKRPLPARAAVSGSPRNSELTTARA